MNVVSGLVKLRVAALVAGFSAGGYSWREWMFLKEEDSCEKELFDVLVRTFSNPQRVCKVVWDMAFGVNVQKSFLKRTKLLRGRK